MSELYNGHGWRIILEPAALPDSRIKKVARVSRADAVHVLAFPEPGKILMLHEFWPYYGTSIWMLPSGKVDKESDIATAAQRELQEETGFRAKEMEFYCSTNHSESFIMTNHIFIAHTLVESRLPQDDDEFIEVQTLSLDDALEKVLSSAKVHTPSAFAILRYLHEHPMQSA